MHVGAIITIPNGVRLSQAESRDSSAVEFSVPAIAHWDLLGKSILERVKERLQVFGVSEISVIAEQATPGSAFWTAWEEVISRYLQFDLQILLLIRVGPYTEVDVADWLRFHRETSSAMTQVYDQQGVLDLVAIDARRLARGEGSFRNRLRSLIPNHQRYRLSGYSNRLGGFGDVHRLRKDALCGRVGIRPSGTEVQPNVWIGENTRIAESARITGPTYIGHDCRVNVGCAISESAIEQQSEIDCGTVVHDSCVQRGTYVGTGLKVRSSVVYQNVFFHLGRNVRLQFRDRRLFGKTFNPQSFLLRRRAATASPDQEPLHERCQPSAADSHL